MAVLRAISERRIEAIVVGGVAAVLQGVPTTTFDLDLVHARDPTNVERLHALLMDLDAVYREHLPKRIAPRERDLASSAHHLLQTRAGPIDILGEIDGGRSFSRLAPHGRVLDLGDGLTVRVLDLAELLAIKTRMGREKDRAAIPLFRRTLQERNRQPPTAPEA